MNTQHALNEATRVAAGATRSRYDGIAITLHWFTVFLVLSLFGLAELWDFAGKPLQHNMIIAHMSLGVLLGATIAARIIWRLLPGHQVAPAGTSVTDTLARMVHWLLYALLAVQSLFGWVVRWSEGEAMSFFGLLMNSPVAPVSDETHDMLQQVHGWVGWAIIIVALGHAAAAFYHHFVLHDHVLARMLPRGKKNVGTKR